VAGRAPLTVRSNDHNVIERLEPLREDLDPGREHAVIVGDEYQEKLLLIAYRSACSLTSRHAGTLFK
jgi:hypothetical protein